jgi:ABC-type amino acid transport substrate-binding protein
MKKFLAIAAASAALLVSAFAAEMEAMVKEVDTAGMTLVLEDGTQLKVADGVSLDGVEAGKKVKVTTDDSGTATAVAVVE